MPRIGRRNGFTLIELLVVIAIVAILATITVGVLKRIGKSSALAATSHAVRSLLRRARNSALEERYPCVVYLDLERGTVAAQLKTSTTRFRFEGGASADPDDGTDSASSAPQSSFTLEGARGVQLQVEQGVAAAGRFGQGLAFAGDDPEESCWASVEHRPVLNPREGVYVSCWIQVGDLDETLYDRPPRYSAQKEGAEFARSGEPAVVYPARDSDVDPDDPPRYTIVRKGGSYAFSVTANYELELVLQGEDDRVYATRTRPGTLVPFRWYEVAAIYDGVRVKLTVNGIARQHVPLRGMEKLPPLLIADSAPLSVSDSHPRRAFFGVIDELELGSLVRSEEIEVPAGVELASPTQQVVFDFMGELDASVHAEPMAIYLTDSPRPLEEASGSDEGTRTQTEAAKRRMQAGQGAYAKFRERLPGIAEENLQTIVVERTGLVR